MMTMESGRGQAGLLVMNYCLKVVRIPGGVSKMPLRKGGGDRERRKQQTPGSQGRVRQVGLRGQKY